MTAVNCPISTITIVQTYVDKKDKLDTGITMG